MKTKKRHLIILIALLLGLLGRGRANAQTTSWDGTQKSGTYWLDSDITLSSESFVINGDLTLVSRGTHTIKNNVGWWMFGTSSHKLTICTQNANDTVYIDGGSVFEDNDARKTCTTQGSIGNLIWVASEGSIDLTNVVLQNVNNTDAYRWGGAIASDAKKETPTSIVLTNCKIRACYTETGGSAILFDNRELHNVTLTNVEIYKCKSETGGTIHTATGGVDVALTIKGGKIHDNESGLYGGGICWFAGRSNNSKLIIKEGTKIYNNIARNNGGGIFGSGYIDIQNAEIYDNQATGEAGIPFDYDQPQYTGSSGGVAQYSTTLTTLYSKGCGGGIFIYPYSGTHTAGMTWHYTSAENYNGQGIYFRVGPDVSIHNNTANNKGGGICIELFGNDYTGYVNHNQDNPIYEGDTYEDPFTICDAVISGTLYENSASQGGGAYIRDYCPKWWRHTYYIGNDPTYSNANANKLKGWSGVLTRTITFDEATIRNNHATTDDGGGVYVLKSIRMKTEEVSNANWEAAHTFCYGWYNNGTSTGWSSNWGSQLTSVWFRNGTKIYENDAIGYGGGVFVNDNTHDLYPTFPANHHCQIHLNDAIIRDNVCGNHGGGMHLHTGQLIIDGNTTITGNRVSTNGELGGGIYFAPATARTLTSAMSLGTASMTVKGNTVNTVPNNLYLPTSMTMYMVSSHTFTPVYIGVYTQGDDAPIPIISGYISGVSDGLTKIHDDKQKYVVTKSDKYYFSTGSPWSPLQQTARDSDLVDSDGDEYYEIGNVKQLTAFLWKVNGINTYETSYTSSVSNLKGKLTANIDMTDHYWVPIANYTGTFDGNGYIISNLSMVPTNASAERGLFGVNSSGTIKNVNLRDCYFASAGSYMGSIVSQMNGGTLSNSVAQCQLTATANTCKAGGLVGHINGGTVHSSIATCELTGYTMGGLAGEISSSGNLYNSFANPQFTVSGGTPNVGGLVAENTGQIENCYVRLGRAQSLGSAHFGMLAATNSGTNTIVKCYAPNGDASQFSHSYTYLYNNATTGLAHCDLYKKVDAPYLYNRPNDNLIGSTGSTMTDLLNSWVDDHANSGYAKWNRSTAGGYSYTYDDGGADITVTGGNINDDYPLPKMQDLCCAASPDGIFIEYKKSLDDMIDKYNGLSGGGTIWLYGSPKEDDGSDELVSETNNDDVLLYIDEDASLLQSSSAKNTLTAYTGQTQKAYWNDGGDRWHNFSSPLRQSQIGISYSNNGQVAYSWEVDPCGVQLSADNDNALFPSDMPVRALDLYSFYEPEYHWINFRRNSASHWHMNANEVQIHYNGNGTGGNGNETYLVPGKGYLVSIDKEQLVQNKGVLNNGNVTLQNVTKTDFNAWAGLLGFNLLGNPYQSYLDFEKFINDGNGTNNGGNLWTGGDDDTYANTYATYDPTQKAYVQYTSNPSQGANTASQYIHPHQGFFVRMTNGTANTNTTTVTYTNDMRTNATDTQSGFRSDGSQPAYPLVNFTVRDGEGNADVAVLEIGRPADEGAPKMRLGDCAGVLSLGHEGKDYGILFRTEIEDYQPLRFEAMEAGTFTLTWNTANADFERLTLIDNIAGTETDMLSRDSYRFEATAEQYASRFKVVIGDYKGVDEPEPAEGPAESFAFQMGDQLVVNGEGTLQVVDMLGRVVMTERLTSSQNMVGLPKAAGVYVLRLTDGGGTRTQKMVVGL